MATDGQLSRLNTRLDQDIRDRVLVERRPALLGRPGDALGPTGGATGQRAHGAAVLAAREGARLGENPKRVCSIMRQSINRSLVPHPRTQRNTAYDIMYADSAAVRCGLLVTSRSRLAIRSRSAVLAARALELARAFPLTPDVGRRLTPPDPVASPGAVPAWPGSWPEQDPSTRDFTTLPCRACPGAMRRRRGSFRAWARDETASLRGWGGAGRGWNTRLTGVFLVECGYHAGDECLREHVSNTVSARYRTLPTLTCTPARWRQGPS